MRDAGSPARTRAATRKSLSSSARIPSPASRRTPASHNPPFSAPPSPAGTRSTCIPAPVPATRSASWRALTAAGVLKREDALELVVLRGRLMGEARNGSMLALVGATLDDTRANRRRRRRHRRQRQRARPGRPVRRRRRARHDRADRRRPRHPRDPPRRRRRVPFAVDGAVRRALPGRARRGRGRRAELHRLLLRERRAVHGRARRARERPDPPCAGARPSSPCTKPERPPSWRSAPARSCARMGKRILKGVPFETPAEGLVHA